MTIRPQTYSTVAIVLHWAIALAIVTLIAAGFWLIFGPRKDGVAGTE